MKQPRTTGKSSKTSLYSITVLYLFIIVLILIFSRQFLSEISGGGRFSNVVIIFSAVILPVALIGIITANIVRLQREKRSGSPGVFFKTRLVLFFSLIAMLSAVPQGVLSVSFLKTAMDSWFTSSMGTALNDGLEIALEYYNDRIQNLENFGESRILQNVIINRIQTEETLWETIREINPLIDSIQIFEETRGEVLFQGDPRVRMEKPPSFETQAGILPKQDYREISVLRYLSNIETDGVIYSVIIGSIFPANFDEQAQRITESIELFTQYRKLQNNFFIALIIVFAFFAIPLLLMAVLIGFILSDEVIRPIVSLEEATRKVAEGDFSIRIFTRTKDELSILIDSFNSMVSELERFRFKIAQTEKVTAWQEIAQQLAHEIKNPLTPIKLSAQRILKKHESGSEDMDRVLKPAIESIIREVDNLDHLLNEFRDFSRQPASSPEHLNLYDLFREILGTYTSAFPAVIIDCSGLDRDTFILGDRKQMTQVFSNILKNAVEAQENTGKIYIRSNLVRKGNNRYCRIQIQDTGKGIAKEHRDKVFNPYFTTKSAGTGLGLPIVERIIFDHKGDIWFETEEGVGTTFFFDLPLGGQA